jgi:hypothetical protein
MSQYVGEELGTRFKADSAKLSAEFFERILQTTANGARNCLSSAVLSIESVQCDYWADSERGWRNGFRLISSSCDQPRRAVCASTRTIGLAQVKLSSPACCTK